MKNLTDHSDYDFVIIGGGASGLLLADQLMDDPFFREHRILIIEKEEKCHNDRTWCYWEAGDGRYDALLYSVWEEAIFKNDRGIRVIDMGPYRYKMLRSAGFYRYIHDKIAKSDHVELLRDQVLEISETGRQVGLKLSKGEITAKKVFNSVRNLDFLHDNTRFPLLQQHFVGWFVKTKEPVFNEKQVTLMDFTIPQNGNTRFMYVLPQDPCRALLEYTLFSAQVLEKTEYEEAIKAYLSKLGVTDYEIVEAEAGNIPMSAFPLHKANSSDVMYIGTAGGWTKASTGYTFYRSMEKAKSLVDFLKQHDDLSAFSRVSRFDVYDRIFLEVLYNNNALGADIFGRMFHNSDPKKIFKFLDNQTGIAEELKIIATMPQGLFIKHFFRMLRKALGSSSH